MLPLRPGRPTEARLARSLASVAGAPLTYGGVGCSLGRATADEGVRTRTWSTVLLGGSDRFERAVEVLQGWAAHRGSGLRVLADGPPRLDQEVAVGVPVGVAHVVACCRVVGVVDHADAWGFAYGTLPLHPERGEESFVVERVGTEVRFTVRACAEPVGISRALGPLAGALQGVAGRRYLAALRTRTSAARGDGRRSS